MKHPPTLAVLAKGRTVMHNAASEPQNENLSKQGRSLGSEVTYLTAGESASCVQNIEAQVQRPWDLWVEQARVRRSPSPRVI